MLICLACVLSGRIVQLDTLTFPLQAHVAEPFTLWRCPGCSRQGELR